MAQFDLQLGLQLKERGLELASEKREDVLSLARKLARQIALRHPKRHCSADDVYIALTPYDLVDDLGPAAGNLFRGAEWEFTGLWTPSRRSTNHGRSIRIWRLKK